MPLDWVYDKAKVLDLDNLKSAKVRQNDLTKPQGSLGQLEITALRMAAMQGTDRPAIDRVWISVFAADHGITAQGVSAFPQIVTQQMLQNFIDGGAAISVLSNALKTSLEVVDVGVVNELQRPSIISDRAAAGTADFSQKPAMSESQLSHAMGAGRRAVERARIQRSQLFIGGEMGIGNTTSATAIACALLDLPARDIVGPGTGLNQQGVAHKAAIIDQALARHGYTSNSPLQSLEYYGGFEIAALCGAYLHCAQTGLPVLVDGFISSVAALVAIQINPGVSGWLFYAHQSAEPGHKIVLDALNVKPLLSLDMHLGEGSGAAVALPLLQMACELHSKMATFDEAGVSNE